MIFGLSTAMIQKSTNIKQGCDKLILDGGVIMVDFGVKLKQLRLQEGMTQQQLANRLGVTKSVVSYYELQERYPSPEVLIKLAGIFRTSSDYLLGLDKKECLDISDLEEEDIEMLKSLVASLRARKCKKTK